MDPEGIAALEALLIAHANGGLDRMVRAARAQEFPDDLATLLQRDDRHAFRRNLTLIYRAHSASAHHAARLAQLIEGGFTLWVFREGGSRDPRPAHLAWDGMVLPAGHPFWDMHFPPNGWDCSCYVGGARSDRGARRMGGDPDVMLGAGWRAADSVDPGFLGRPPFALSDLLHALAARCALARGPQLDELMTRRSTP